MSFCRINPINLLTTSPLHLVLVIFAFRFLQSWLVAEEGKSELSDNSLRVKGIFNSVLPGTERKNSYKLILHPHFGDLSKRDYIRSDVGLSYGITDKWDVMAMTRFYFGHGLKDAGLFSDPGLADYEVETKIRFGSSIFRGWDSAINLSYAAPLGNPAPNVTDGLIHHEVTLSSARYLESHPDVRIFFGFTTDIISQTDVQGRRDDNELRDSNQSFSGGFVVERKSIHYTFETSYSTTRIWGSTKEDVYSVRPGLIWSIPRRYTWDSKANWLIGVAIPVSFGPDGTDIGIGAKLRLDFKFRSSSTSEEENRSSEVSSVADRRR
jgi:hypothetical protein